MAIPWLDWENLIIAIWNLTGKSNRIPPVRNPALFFLEDTVSKYEHLTNQIESNLRKLKSLDKSDVNIMALILKNSELIEQRNNLTIGEASEMVA